MLSFELCLKRAQRVVSGALKEYQATDTLNALGVGRYHVVPWAMMCPVVERQVQWSRGLQECRPSLCLGLGVHALVGCGTLFSDLFLRTLQFVRLTGCMGPGADISVWCWPLGDLVGGVLTWLFS